MITLHGEEVKVGDRVWHFSYGWGEVIIIDEESIRPICVQWETGYEWFTKEGESYSEEILNKAFPAMYKIPVLFWQPIVFEIPKKPKQKEKAWQWICKEVGRNHFYLTTECFASKEEAIASGADIHGYYEVLEPYLPSEIEMEVQE